MSMINMINMMNIKGMFGVEDRVPNKKALQVAKEVEPKKQKAHSLGNLRECVVAELWWVLNDC